MSEDSAKKWFNWIHDTANKEYFDKLQTYSSVDEKLSYAKELGYDFTADEYVAAVKESMEALTSSNAEVKDEDLQNVMGGVDSSTGWPGWPGFQQKTSSMVYASPGGFSPNGPLPE